jgi:hypothetical protein
MTKGRVAVPLRFVAGNQKVVSPLGARDLFSGDDKVVDMSGI